MKLSILIASLASLSGALADRVDLWERPNFRGPHATYVSASMPLLSSEAGKRGNLWGVILKANIKIIQTLGGRNRGIMAVPFVFRSYSWHRTEGSTCCAGFCKGNMPLRFRTWCGSGYHPL
uniref:Uncharacterized protein n=1 Tax=Coccidioides posadasii RMSCC 3488 TaxID=454284 RepID=A0A0J6F7M7_COCPO|nr:hypothetical protein CPAG_01296 [Coccidioides posadasii RMSCC 3488]